MKCNRDMMSGCHGWSPSCCYLNMFTGRCYGDIYIYIYKKQQLVGGLEHVYFFAYIGNNNSKFQLTFIFFRGVGRPPTRQDHIGGTHWYPQQS